jgi:glycosyltransferase involved in cell wall biosynthesis
MTRARSNELRGVALVSREYPPFFGGGIGTYARHIAPALAQAGVSVHVITESHDASCGRVETDGRVTVHRIPFVQAGPGWGTAAARFSCEAARTVMRLWRRGAISVAEFAECEAAGVAMTAMGRVTRERPATVVHLHTPTEVLAGLGSVSTGPSRAVFAAYMASERLSVAHADLVTAPSRFIAEWVARWYRLAVMPTVIPYAVPTAVSDTAPIRGRRVLYMGRIEPRKGVEPLIRAWTRVARACPSVELRLAGADTGSPIFGGSVRAYLESIIPPDVRTSVRFLGRLDRSRLDREIAEAALCVVPSLWENYPNTCIEAMQRGRPVVVSSEGGMREMVGATEAGLVFPTGDHDACAQAILTLVREHDDELEHRGRVGRERILAECDPRQVAAARIDAYTRALRRPSGSDASERLAAWRDLSRVGRAVASGDDGPEWLPAPARSFASPLSKRAAAEEGAVA